LLLINRDLVKFKIKVIKKILQWDLIFENFVIFEFEFVFLIIGLSQVQINFKFFCKWVSNSAINFKPID
jgi:hypothetical protein